MDQIVEAAILSIVLSPLIVMAIVTAIDWAERG